LTLTNTKFEGFSYDIETSVGKGKLSTKELGITKLLIAKQGLSGTGKVHAEATDIYVKGFLLELDKNKKKETEKKLKSG
ncbi:MAG: hypothetical protein AAF734_00870, partial [Bacteroidota bacterium]